MADQCHTTTALPPGKRHGTHCAGGWVIARVLLDGCGKLRPRTGLDPRAVRPVASWYTDFRTFSFLISTSSPAPWPQCLRRNSVALRWVGLRVRIPPRVWVSVYCERCVLWGRGLCDGPIPRPEEYIIMCVCVCHWVW